MDKTKLLEYMSDLAITADEKKMWETVGFYITRAATAYNHVERCYKHYYVSPAGDKWHIPDFVAKSIRVSVIHWWEQGRSTPFTNLDELEVQRG